MNYQLTFTRLDFKNRLRIKHMSQVENSNDQLFIKPPVQATRREVCPWINKRPRHNLNTVVDYVAIVDSGYRTQRCGWQTTETQYNAYFFQSH